MDRRADEVACARGGPIGLVAAFMVTANGQAAFAHAARRNLILEIPQLAP